MAQEIVHEHVQRDHAALQAAEKKFAAAKERVQLAVTLCHDAEQALHAARLKFQASVAAAV